MYYLWRLDPSSTAYLIQIALRLERPSLEDAARLRMAFESLPAANPSLTARFEETPAGVRQRIFPGAPLPVMQTQLTGDTDPLAALEAAARQPVDLARGCCRLDLITLGEEQAPQELLALFSVHHIIFDGVSADLLLAQLETGLQDVPVTTPDTYIEAMDALAAYPEQEAYQKSRGFWREELKSIRDFAVRHDRTRPDRQTFNGDVLRFSLDPQTTDRLTKLGNGSAHAPLLALFATALHGFSDGQCDFAIGTTFHNRTRSQRQLMANLSNTLPFAAALAPGASFGRYLGTVRRKLLRLARHRAVPTAHIVAMAEDCDRRRAPVFQTLFVHHNAEIVRRIGDESPLDIPGMSSRPRFVDLRIQSGQFELALEAMNIGGRFLCTLKFNTDLFSRTTIASLADALQQIARRSVEDPDATVGDLAEHARRHDDPTIDHLGYAVSDIQTAVDHLKRIHRVAEVSPIIRDRFQDADLCMVRTETGERIELVSGEAVKRQIGRSVALYHTCEAVDDLDAAIARRVEAGELLVSPPKPAPLFDYRRVAFVSGPLGLTELLERPGAHPHRITTLANFTDAPMSGRLKSWANFMRWPRDVHRIGHEQVIEALVGGERLQGSSRHDVQIVMIHPDPDWTVGQADHYCAAVGDALEGYVARSHGLTIAVLCPSLHAEPRALSALHDRLRKIAGLCTIDARQGFDDPCLDVASLIDIHGYRAGRIPYRPAFFDRVAYEAARLIHLHDRRPHKVIAVDCDDTLWEGILGEAGPDGIRMGRRHIALQRFLRNQRERGVLIALASKNDEGLVRTVLRERPEMVLREEDLVATKVNWQPKAHNLQDLARELDLSLSSFVFIDDNPAECAEMRHLVPEVTTLELPQDVDLERFLAHYWPLDIGQQTAEDAARTSRYREEVARAGHRARAASLVDYIDDLELKLAVAPVDEKSAPRAEQMTRRVTQFNLNGRFCDAATLMGARDDLAAFMLHVRDRFGDYGNAGLFALGPVTHGEARVTHLLLSCRALGRSVEYRLARLLAEAAREKGADRLAFEFEATDRNTPMSAFLDRIGVMDSPACRIGVDRLAAMDWRDFVEEPQPDAPATPARETPEPTGVDRGLHEWIARELSTPEGLAAFHDPTLQRDAPDPSKGSTSTLECLCAAAEKVLPGRAIDPHLSFAEIGGDSLSAVAFLSEVGSRMQVSLDLHELLGGRTLSSLAHGIDSKRAGVVRDDDVALLKEGDDAQVVFVHPAGGDCQCYAHLVADLPEGVSAIGLNRKADASARKLSDVATTYVDRLRGRAVSGERTVFVGWSLGASIALEMARQTDGTALSPRDVLLLDPIRPKHVPDAAALRDLVRAEIGTRAASGSISPADIADYVAPLVERDLHLLTEHRTQPVGNTVHIVNGSVPGPLSSWTEAIPAEQISEASKLLRVEADHFSLLSTPKVRQRLHDLVAGLTKAVS
ncbi:HAD-IIIC family phosphatase [Rhodovulum sp. 12E13]|nr:HAD-IIIC family phosphatase [Rhodovulum sp. 12E13]